MKSSENCIFFINLTAELKICYDCRIKNLHFYHHVSILSAKFRLGSYIRSEVDIIDVKGACWF